MEFIKPSEISARIFTLFDESDEWVIIVSPYMRISKWYKLIKKFNALKIKKIPVDIYVREDPDNNTTYGDLDQLALPYKKIPHLHGKLYMNEKCGIVTSMNLLLSSEINSLEIGYSTKTRSEHNELLEFYHRYIHKGKPVHRNIFIGQPAADLNKIMHCLSEEFKRSAKNSWTWLSEDLLQVCTALNNYSISINNGRLKITTCLKINIGTKQLSIHQSRLIAEKIRDLTTMKIEVYPDTKRGTFQITGQTHQKLKSNSSHDILEAEVVDMVQSAGRFIDVTDNLAMC